MNSERPEVYGLGLDPQTRCAHYHSPLDVIAIKMRCCGRYFACRACHDALEAHPAEIWPREEWNERAVRCGVCGTELTIGQYLGASDRCPCCGAGFNPVCRNHYPLYFATLS